ncbi:group III secreted phospholipase A2-3A2-like [Arapaima gigas]
MPSCSPLLCAVFLALGCCPPAVAEVWCHWTSGFAAGRLAHTFLQRSAGSLRLFHSTWTQSGKLVDCVATDHPVVVQSYLSECRRDRSARFSDVSDERVNISRLLALGSACQTSLGGTDGLAQRRKRELRIDAHASSERSDSILRRQKRAWIFPGTLWCGLGNKASSYEDLGVFAQTDRCCREHDHCKETISSFEANYGFFNRNFFTVSHCDCDRRFRQCLLGVNDTISNTVGYTYFNILKIPCFLLKDTMQCTQMTWWGKCNVSQVSLLAVLKDAIMYNSTYPIQEVEEVSNLPTSVPADKSSKTNPNPEDEEMYNLPGSVPRTQSTPWELPHPTVGTFKSITSLTTRSPRHPEYSPTLRISSAVKLAPTHFSTLLLQGSTSHPVNWDPLESLENALPTIPPPTVEMDPSNHVPLIQDTKHRSMKQLCASYKHLDECMYKIPPREERFGLSNLQSKTLYHCNCTRRWARQFNKMKKPDNVQSLLLDFVALSCFKMPPPEECTRRKRCSAVLSKAPHIQRVLRWGDEVDVRKLPETPVSKGKGQNMMAPKRRPTPGKLYRRCLRLVSSNHKKVD